MKKERRGGERGDAIRKEEARGGDKTWGNIQGGPGDVACHGRRKTFSHFINDV